MTILSWFILALFAWIFINAAVFGLLTIKTHCTARKQRRRAS
jgi:hypothetical protein